MTNERKYPRSIRKRDALHLVARQYSSENLKKPKEYWDDTLAGTFEWGNLGDFEVMRQVGRGKYGEVYESTNAKSKQHCVIKIMRPVKEHRLRREIKILNHVRGHRNIVTLLDVLRDGDTKTPCFVFEFVDAISFRELQASVTDLEVRHYMYQLLEALDHCHSKGIMHRDVKPGNVLIDHTNKVLKLIDWGLADFYHPGKEYPVRVATRFYKGPELLVDIRDYDYSLDVWGVGCMMAALIFKRPVFFRGEDEFDQLVKIARVLGSDGLHKYCDKYGITLDAKLEQLVGIRPAVPWRKFKNTDNEHLCSQEAFDLLSRILRYDHHERLTCQEAMAHPYFAPVRDGTAARATATARAAASLANVAGQSSSTFVPANYPSNYIVNGPGSASPSNADVSTAGSASRIGVTTRSAAAAAAAGTSLQPQQPQAHTGVGMTRVLSIGGSGMAMPVGAPGPPAIALAIA